MFVSKLEYKLIEKMANILYKDCNSNIVSLEDVTDALNYVVDTNNDDSRMNFCSALETLYYCFSVILSEVRQKKRSITTAIFSQNPKLAQEKSVLKEKLDAEPEYANLHRQEEQLFQFIEHIQNIKNNITYLYKEEEIPIE